jgi:uncharacterized membrane protein HdeD (DUF308 family)
MLDVVARNWWVFAIRGVAAIVFGLGALVWPSLTLAILVALFAAYALVDGASLLIALVRGDPIARRNAWAVGLIGVVGILVGVGTLVWPNITALTLLYIVAFWAIFLGVIQVAAAIQLRREIDNELWLGLGGVLSVAFGVLLVVNPGAGLLSLVWIVGYFAILFGLTSLALAYRLRSLPSTRMSAAR